MSRRLLDTHVVLWWLSDAPELSAAARTWIADPSNVPLVSAVSLWEIAIKQALGKVSAPDDLPARIDEQGFRWLEISPAHAWNVRSLAMHHRDPFDRLLIAQALSEQVQVITRDPRFRDYGVEVSW